MSVLRQKLSTKIQLKIKGTIFNIFTFSSHDNNQFLLLLQKSFYPYEYMDDWGKFNETLILEKQDFYSHLNLEDIIDADYVHAKGVCKDFEIKNLGEFQDLYVQIDTLF